MRTQRKGVELGVQGFPRQRCPNQDTENKYVFSRLMKGEGHPREKESKIQKDTKKYKVVACLGKSKLCSVVRYVVSCHGKNKTSEACRKKGSEGGRHLSIFQEPIGQHMT